MKYARWLAALVIALGGGLEARAQIAVAPLPGPAFSTRSFGIGFAIPSKRPKIIIGGSYGFGFGPAFGGSGPVVISVPSISVLTPTQPPVVNPPVVISNPPPAGEMDLIDPIIIRPRPKAQQGKPIEHDDAPLPGAPAGGFRPVRPEDRMRAQQAVPPEREDKKPPKERLPRPPEPELKPKEEAARQIALGREAFANQEYGRAAERFQEAARVFPQDPLAYFLLAQADFALGKYREATAAIHDGLRRKADWPAGDFRPIEMYGPNVADYAEHLGQLRLALKENPRDPVLFFLLAYQLWFDGQRDEARILFHKALPLVAEPRFIHLFLDGQGGVRVVAR
jgi:hypothetical protein